MVNANIRADGLVIVLIGSGPGSDGGGYGILNGRLVPIPNNNPELRRLIAATESVQAVEAAGETVNLADLGKIAQATMLDAAGKLSAGIHAQR
jgi:hypothetical protein